MKRLALAAPAICALAAVAVPAAVEAWGNTGHRLIGVAAVRGLPDEMPAFLREAVAPAPAPAPTVEPPPASLRNVTPLGVTPGPAPQGPLLRVPVAAVAAPVELKPDDVYRRVMVLDAASFRAVREKTPIIVRIAGIAAPSFKDTCTDPA